MLKIFNRYDDMIDRAMTMLLAVAVGVLLLHFGAGLIKHLNKQDHGVRIVRAGLIQQSEEERMSHSVCK